VFAVAGSLLLSEEPLLVKGEVRTDENFPKVIAKEILPLADAKKHWKGKVHIHFQTPGLERETLVSIQQILAAHKGPNALLLHFNFPNHKTNVIAVGESLKIQPSDAVIEQIQALLGEDAVRFE
jgi:hypothetical protein